MRLSSALLCALVAETAALHIPGGAPCDTMRRPAPSPSSAMHLRGGLGSIDPELVAKVGMGFIAAEATVFTLAPGKALELNKIRTPSSMMEWFTEQTGFMHTAAAIIGVLALAGKPLQESLAWALIPFLLQCIKAMLNDTPTKLGSDNTGIFVVMLVHAFSSWALFTDADYAPNVVKFLIAFFVLNGATFVTVPGMAFKAWGFPSRSYTPNPNLEPTP